MNESTHPVRKHSEVFYFSAQFIKLVLRFKITIIKANVLMCVVKRSI